MTAIDFDSTLIRRGIQAATFGQMADFAVSIENRPLQKLLADLPGLAQLSDVKFRLARQVIRRRARALPDVEREQLRIFAAEVASTAPADVARRISELFD